MPITTDVSSNPVHDEVYSIQHYVTKFQWLATGQWFSLGTPVSSTNKTDSHDITEILLEVALNTINQTKTIILLNTKYTKMQKRKHKIENWMLLIKIWLKLVFKIFVFSFTDKTPVKFCVNSFNCKSVLGHFYIITLTNYHNMYFVFKLFKNVQSKLFVKGSWGKLKMFPLWAVAFYVQVKNICTIHQWKNKVALHRLSKRTIPSWKTCVWSFCHYLDTKTDLLYRGAL